MPTFTMELKTAIDLKPADWSVDKWIGLDDYPLFGNGEDNARRTELNQKIVREYFNCEIGMETISMFQYAVRRKMHKEMPLFNLLYESAAAEFDALITTDMVSTGTSSTTADGTTNSTVDQTGATTGSANSVNTNSSDSASKSLTVNSDFPQSALSDRGAYASGSVDGDGTSTVTANAEATDTSNNTSTVNSTDVGSTTGKTDTLDTNTVKGYQGNAAELILAKRATFLNLDARVVDMLADCFMQIWSDGEQHLMRGY